MARREAAETPARGKVTLAGAGGNSCPGALLAGARPAAGAAPSCARGRGGEPTSAEGKNPRQAARAAPPHEPQRGSRYKQGPNNNQKRRKNAKTTCSRGEKNPPRPQFLLLRFAWPPKSGKRAAAHHPTPQRPRSRALCSALQQDPRSFSSPPLNI